MKDSFSAILRAPDPESVFCRFNQIIHTYNAVFDNDGIENISGRQNII